MANAARGEVTLELGGERYVLRPTFGAVCEIEDAIGTSLFEIGSRLERAEITARELVDFAHACLTRSGYAIDRERLGETMVEDGPHDTLMALVRFCRNYAFGGREEKKVDAPPSNGAPRSQTIPSGNT